MRTVADVRRAGAGEEKASMEEARSAEGRPTRPRSWFRNVWVGDPELFGSFRDTLRQEGQTVQQATHEALRLYVEACRDGRALPEPGNPAPPDPTVEMPRPHPKLWVQDRELFGEFRAAALEQRVPQRVAACQALSLYIAAHDGQSG